MTEQNEFRACPLFFYSGDFSPLKLPLVEVLYAVDYDPWQTSAEVDSFVHDETHDTGCENIVLHVGVPALHGVLAREVAGCFVLHTAHKRSKMFK